MPVVQSLTTSKASWRNAFLKRLAIATISVFLLTAWGISYGYWFINDAITNDLKRTVIGLPTVAMGKPANYLIIGSDSRAFVKTKKQQEQFGSKATETGQRSDTMMVAHVDPKAKTTLLVSFPRDLWVDIPGLGFAKLNAAFNHGPKTVIATLKKNFDIQINHYIEVDFAGFKSIVDSIGTVNLFFPTIARDLFTGLNVTTPGCQPFNGERALQYVRSRHYEYKNSATGPWHSDGSADLGRIARQQYFMRSLASAALHQGLSSLTGAQDLIRKSLRSLTADERLTSTDLFSLYDAFHKTDPGSFDMQTIPADSGRSDDGKQSILRMRASAALPLLQRLRSTQNATSSTATATTPVQPAKIKVHVLNGSGHAKAAAKALSELVQFGFKANGAGNAARVDVAKTEVRYPTGHRDLGETALAYLGGVGVLREDVSLFDGEVEIVLGTDFAGTALPGQSATGQTSTTQSSSSTIPANPGHTKGVTRPSTTGNQPLVGCG